MAHHELVPTQKGQPDQEAPLARKAEVTPGPLIRATLGEVQVPLMGLSGMAIERITRERTGVPPGFELPERPVYFFDPVTRRMIMMSNRVSTEPYKSGLFAEIVELDENGKPIFSLSSSAIDMNDTSYQIVAVGPNAFKMPPSHLEVEENGDKTVVTWNFWLGNIQNWMNETGIAKNETLDEFLARYDVSVTQAQVQAAKQVEKAFPRGEQGFDNDGKPVNLIITDEDENGPLATASREAGLFPFVKHPKDIADEYNRLITPSSHDFAENIILYLPLEKRLLPAVVSIDNLAINEFQDRENYSEGVGALTRIAQRFQERNPLFATVWVWPNEQVKPRKEANGAYQVGNNPEYYKGLFMKLKADFYLTKLARGKSAITR